MNTAGYYDPLVQMVEHMISAGFIKPHNRDLFLVESEPQPLLDHLAKHVMPQTPRTLRPEET